MYSQNNVQTYFYYVSIDMTKIILKTEGNQ